jgi:hypothetical protein
MPADHQICGHSAFAIGSTPDPARLEVSGREFSRQRRGDRREEKSPQMEKKTGNRKEKSGCSFNRARVAPMAIPDFQSLMLPLLEALADGQEHTNREITADFAKKFGLTDDELTRCPIKPFGTGWRWNFWKG